MTVTLSILPIYAYFWLCWMFGFWYFFRRWGPKWDPNNFPLSLCSAVASIAVSWFGWPLMVVYLLSEWYQTISENQKAEKEKIREAIAKRGEGWSK